MRAYQLTPGSPYKIELKNIQTPAAPGDNEVTVQIKAASLNYRDLLVIAGQYGSQDLTGRIPLSDGAGLVTAVGSAVRNLKVGDRVAGIFMRDWIAGPIKAEYAFSARGGAIDGMLCEYSNGPEKSFVKIPEHLSYLEAATLPCAGVTAWNAINSINSTTTAAKTLVVQGTGGVSIFALQIAKVLGWQVIVISSNDNKLKIASQLKADYLINYKNNPNWATRVLDICPTGADLVIDVGGPDTLPQSLKAIKVGGTIAEVGVLSGTQLNLTTTDLIRRAVTLKGIFVGSQEHFIDLNELLKLNQLRPIIDRTFHFNESIKAYEYLKSAQHLGKVVIDLDRL